MTVTAGTMCAPHKAGRLTAPHANLCGERRFAHKSLRDEIQNPSNGHSHCLWPVLRHRNVGDICFGRAASVLRSGIRRIVRLGVYIWIPARRLAIWPGRSDLGVGCSAPLVAKGILTPALGLIFQKSR